MTDTYIFTATYFDEIDRIEKTASGLVFGSDMSEAIIQLANYYGDECLNEVKLSYLGEHEPAMVILPDNIVNSPSFLNEVKKVNYW